MVEEETAMTGLAVTGEEVLMLDEAGLTAEVKDDMTRIDEAVDKDEAEIIAKVPVDTDVNSRTMGVRINLIGWREEEEDKHRSDG
jgi:hypothetical protein